MKLLITLCFVAQVILSEVSGKERPREGTSSAVGEENVAGYSNSEGLYYISMARLSGIMMFFLKVTNFKFH